MSKWPKTRPPLNAEQLAVYNEFTRHWLEELPKRFGLVETFNHSYSLPDRPPGRPCRTLEIGAGLGEHIAYENLEGQEYHCIEWRDDLAQKIHARFPSVDVHVGDVQQHLDFPDDHFDRIVAIHVLEHLLDLPAALKEVHRVLKPDGILSVVIPCDPGLAYALARKISAERMFVKRYHQPYDWVVRLEHVNRPQEVLEELGKASFKIGRSRYFPLLIPIITVNLCIGLTLRPALSKPSS